jgi:transcriptional regulator with XRE-family HTH domain
MRFADRLKELREQAGLSQPQLAAASGLPVGSIRQYEQGRRDPLWQVLFKLADALGVSAEAFRDCIDACQGEGKPSTARGRQRTGNARSKR